jgi:predicted Zn-dependent protease
LVGLAPQSYRETLRNAARSLRPLTEIERGSVIGKRLRIVTARQSEHLEDLSARAGNAWSPAYAALVNGLAPEIILREGQLLKIAPFEPIRR